LGIIVGVVFVILKEQFSNIFQSEKDVENTLKLPVIAMVPAADGGGEEIE
jgi:capsular polysaccharide biosynthesis protein